MIPVIRNTVLPWIIKLILFTPVVILALVQLVHNRKNIKNRTLTIAGIVVSSLCLLLAILFIPGELPSFLVYVKLDIVSFQYIINALVMYLIQYGIVGHILLLISYIRSLPQKSVTA